MLDQSAIEEARGIVVRTRVRELIAKLGCIHNGKAAYKLPSREAFSSEFLLTTPLLQNEPSMDQIGQWVVAELRAKLFREGQPILLVAATAPAVLFANAIVERCADVDIHLYDLGYYFAFDEDDVFRANEWPNALAIIVTDIIDSGGTVARFRSLLDERLHGSRHRFAGCICGTRNGFRERCGGLFWEQWTDPHTKTTLPAFFVTEWGKPAVVSESEAKQLYPEDRRYLIEPYSLEPFRYSSLVTAPPDELEKTDSQDTKNRRRLAPLKRLGLYDPGTGSTAFITYGDNLRAAFPRYG